MTFKGLEKIEKETGLKGKLGQSDVPYLTFSLWVKESQSAFVIYL